MQSMHNEMGIEATSTLATGESRGAPPKRKAPRMSREAQSDASHFHSKANDAQGQTKSPTEQTAPTGYSALGAKTTYYFHASLLGVHSDGIRPRGSFDMRIARIVLMAAALAYPGLAAEPGDGESTLAELQAQPPLFCNEVYALCIKAPCTQTVTYNSTLGAYALDKAVCTCEVLKGWSMGPGKLSCSARAPVTQDGRTYIISTYSNAFNQTALNGLKNTLTCDSTVWAWCYGSPCIVDKNDTTKATCTCPMLKSKMSTLGGSCRQNACNGLWSAAAPKADEYANNTFAAYMRTNHPDVPSNPPAQACMAQ